MTEYTINSSGAVVPAKGGAQPILITMTADEFRAASDLFEDDIAADLDPEGIANARTTYGGTGIEAVKQQLAEAKAAL